MSLTLDEVRRVRFRMARRNAGYEVSDVDLFIDKVESAFQQFENERDLLRREAEAGGGGSDDGATQELLAGKDAEISQLRGEIDRLQQVSSQDHGDQGAHLAELERRNHELQEELQRVRAELSDIRSQRVGEQVGQAETIQVTTREEASPAVIRLVQLATEQAEQLVDEAGAEASRKLEEAKQRAREITTDAQTKAERIESEARVNAQQRLDEARRNAEQVDIDAENRRHELFDGLEHERDSLSGKVASLRSFEEHYRTNLRSFFQHEIELLDNDHPEPEDVPELAPERSRTPRLDRLAGENQE